MAHHPTPSGRTSSTIKVSGHHPTPSVRNSGTIEVSDNDKLLALKEKSSLRNLFAQRGKNTIFNEIIGERAEADEDKSDEDESNSMNTDSVSFDSKDDGWDNEIDKSRH